MASQNLSEQLDTLQSKLWTILRELECITGSRPATIKREKIGKVFMSFSSLRILRHYISSLVFFSK